jgi:hypothetical protein
MPLEIWDTDNPAHPPRVLCAYLTSEVALAVISTQSLRESTEARSIASSARKGPPRVPAEAAEARFESIAVEMCTEKEESALRPPPPGRSSTAAEEVTIQLGSLAKVSTGAYRLLVLDAGAQTQRKESLEWMVGVENASGEEMTYSVTPMVAEDAELWLGLGQSGGRLRAGERASFAVYARRTIALGSYVSYILVRNRAEPADCLVLKVCMEVVAEAKRAPTLLPIAAAAARIASSSVENLASLDTSQVAASSSTDAQESCLFGASGSALDRGSGRASPLTGSASALSLEAVGRPPSASLGVASRDADGGVGGSMESSSAIGPEKSDHATTSSAVYKTLYQLSIPGRYCATDGAMGTFSGEDSEFPAAPAIGLSLSPLPSPSENVRKHLAITANAVVVQQRAQLTATSLADVALPLSALTACCRTEFALAVAFGDQGTVGLSVAAVAAQLTPRGSLTLTVHATSAGGRVLGGADLMLQLATPRALSEPGADVPGLLGQVLLSSPLVPDQVQAVDVLLRDGANFDD